MSIVLTDEQNHVIKEIVKDIRNGKKISTIGGLAGVGKTTIVRFIKNKLSRYKVCAYTGKAVDILKQKGIDASTIHSLIYETHVDSAGNANWVLRDSLDCQGIVIDEASMVNEEIYSDLKYFNIPLIFIGDHGQLPPVGGKDFNLMGNPDYRLEEIHRNAGDIAHFANHIRQGLNPHDFPKSKQIEFVYQLSDDVLIKADQVICAYNATRVKLNKQIRAKLGYKDFLVNGDKVMCLRNNRKVGIFNGMQGKVSNYHIEKGRVYIDFEANGFFPKLEIDPIAFHSEKPTFDRDPDSPHPFEYAYAITAHKSQGDQFDSVCVLEQKCNNWDHNRWFYTAVSRAKSKLIIIPADKPKAKVDLTDPTLKEIFGL